MGNWLKLWVPIIIVSLIISITLASSVDAQGKYSIPAWVKGVANFWVEGNISDTEFGESISFLIEHNILRVEMPDDGEWKAEADKLYKENKKLEAENKKLKRENAELQAILNSVLVETDRNSYLDDSEYLDNGCPVGFPYLWSDGLCYVVSEPNCTANYPYSWSDGFCYKSPEYLDSGCHSDFPYLWSDGFCYTIPEYTYDEPVDSAPRCDPSYPDVCIPPYPPDLDCDEIYYSNFRVVGNDPHGFDRDNDGIGCEVGSPPSSNCDPSYPDVCIPPYPPDLNCGDIGYSNFRVTGSDPHGFDRDNDGIGCES